MSRTAVDLPLYPGFEGPYSQGAAGGGILYTSGQLPFDPEAGRIVDGSVAAQVRMCLQNIERIVVAGGSDMDCVIRCCVFARRYSDFQAVSRAYAEAFSEPYPARTFITVADLPEGVDVIIEAVAFVPETGRPSEDQ